MAMGRKRPVQQPLFVRSDEMAGAPRHRFYEKLNEILGEAGFDRFVEALCEPYFAEPGSQGRLSTPPGRYYRMLLVGYFEGIESERGICWRIEDSLSLKAFIGCAVHERTPDHSTLSRLRTRLPLTAYEQVFHFVMRVLNEQGLLQGRVAGVDSTYLRADASMKNIVRRGSGEGYKGYLKRLAKESGIQNPTDEDARRFDRTRTKTTSNKDWVSATDGDAEITRLKDGRTRLAYKAEHTVDMETGAVLAAEILPATTSDAESIITSTAKANENITAAREDSDDDHDDDDDRDGGCTVGTDTIEEVVGDKGYHKASTLQHFADEGVRTYIPERLQKHRRRWRDNGGREMAVAVYQNRARVKTAKSKRYQRQRGELLERTFAHLCETGGHRRTRLRGRENVHKRYLLQAAAFNLGLVMRKLVGRGTPRGLADAAARLLALFALCLATYRLAWHRVWDNRARVLPLDPYLRGQAQPVSSTGC
jgi:transposase